MTAKRKPSKTPANKKPETRRKSETASGGQSRAAEKLRRETAKRKRAEEALLLYKNQMGAVAQIGAMANSTLDISEVLNNILTGTLKAAGASVGMIFLVDTETGCLHWGASHGLSEAFVEAFRDRVIKPGEGLSGLIAQTGEAIYIPEDSSHDPRIRRPVIGAEGLNSFIGVPVYAEGRIVAVMNVLTRPPDILHEDKIALIKAVGIHIGSAIRNARLFKERRRVEEELIRSEEKYREVVEGTADLITRVNEQGKFTYVNQVGKKILGFTPDQLIGMSAFDFIHPDDREATIRWFNDVTTRRLSHATAENRQINRSTGEVHTMIWTSKFYYGPNGEVTGVNGIGRDITGRKRAEEMLLEMHTLLDDAQKLSKLGGWKYDIATGHITWTDEVYRIYGVGKDYDPDDVDRDISFYSPEDAETISNAFKKAVSSGEPYDLELRFVRLNGERIWVRTIGTPITENGRVVSVTGNIMDITGRKQAEEELRKFKFISDQSSDAHFLVDRDARFRYVNKTACRMLGYTEDELLTLSVPDVDTVYDKAKYHELFHLTQREKVAPVESLNKRKDGSVFPSEMTVTGYVLGDVPYMFAALRDITDRKKTEEAINASLKEKEVLLREIHHRVKNNMTIVYSLLEMQTRYTSDSNDREMLNDAKARIKSMALIHEKLYGSRDLARVDFNDYLRDILQNMFMSYLTDPARITRKLDVRNVALTIDDAIPCGLIINELVSNSLKHAFPEGRKGEIALTMTSDEKDGVELTVEDDGIGLPEDLDLRKKKSMGLSLVDALVGQLRGKIKHIRKQGTGFRITFTKRK